MRKKCAVFAPLAISKSRVFKRLDWIVAQPEGLLSPSGLSNTLFKHKALTSSFPSIFRDFCLFLLCSIQSNDVRIIRAILKKMCPWGRIECHGPKVSRCGQIDRLFPSIVTSRIQKSSPALRGNHEGEHHSR